MRHLLCKYHTTLCLFVIIYLLSPGLSYAEKIYLAPGESHLIKTQENIDSVFVSASEIADYEIIGNNSVIFYAKKEGLAEFTLFNEKNDPIIKTTMIVDNIIRDADKRIRAEYPDSNVIIQKIGNSYILTGTAPTEESRNIILQIVGEAAARERRIPDATSYQSDDIYNGIINRITLPMSNQVNVKLTIAEVTKDFSENIGLDWSSGGGSSGTFTFFKFDAAGISTLVHAIQDDSIARVLAEPNLSVLSGESASFLAGGEIPIPQSSANNQTNVTYKEFGIKLNISAKVNEKKRIRVMLSEEVSTLTDVFASKAGEAFPALQSRKANTTVELGDGESFVLGGLISNTEMESLKKIPFIGEIPILGALFRNATTKNKRTELIVVATVNLVKPLNSKDIVLPDFMYTSTVERFFNFTDIHDLHNQKQARNFLRQGGFIK